MEEDVILEYYPEILMYIFPKSVPFQNRQKTRTMVIPSLDSLRMYTTARFFKRKYNNNMLRTSKTDKFRRVILVKKFAGLKRFRRGIKLKIRNLPCLVLDRFFLCQIIIVSKKELDNIFKEILATSK